MANLQFCLSKPYLSSLISEPVNFYIIDKKPTHRWALYLNCGKPIIIDRFNITCNPLYTQKHV